MTDITELAQSLKAAAEKAQIEEGLTWFSEEQLSHEDGIALHKADAEFIAMANPANILALVEALEKAQTKAIEQGRTSCELFDEVTALRQRIAELEEAEQQLCAANVTLDARAELAERQLADLESRTVTVKLTEPFKLAKSSSGLTYYYADDVNEALSAAGIKWEAE